jgi:hypothetical protein
MRLVKTPRVVAIYFVLAMIAIIVIMTIFTQVKYSDNFSEKSCDNRDNHRQQEDNRISRKIENAISYQP